MVGKPAAPNRPDVAFSVVVTIMTCRFGVALPQMVWLSHANAERYVQRSGGRDHRKGVANVRLGSKAERLALSICCPLCSR
jgi:hypothetical protein